MKKLIVLVLIPLLISPIAFAKKSKGSEAQQCSDAAAFRRGPEVDHIGAYNWRVTVDSFSRDIEPPIAVTFPTYVAADDDAKETDVKTNLNDPKDREYVTFTFAKITYSNNPELLEELIASVEKSGIEVELQDTETGEQLYFNRFAGKIKSIRIKTRLRKQQGVQSLVEVVEIEILERSSKG